MKILFISYAAVSLSGGQVRPVALLRALADAGHRVDLLAPFSDLPAHPNIRILLERNERKPRRGRLRWAGIRAVGQVSYEAIHAIDDAVFFAHRLSHWKKIPLVYDAVRRFTDPAGTGVPRRYRLFPSHFQRLESTVLERAGCIFSPCSALTADLTSLNRRAAVIQLEDIPLQPLHGSREGDKPALLKPFGRPPASVVVCCALPGWNAGFRDILVAARKVVDDAPDTAFFIKCAQSGQARKMAANLDIADRFVFISDDDPETFLSVLDIADAILFVPQAKSRYIHPQVYTLLNAPAPLVAVHDAAYDEILTQKTAVRVLPGSEAISEGILRTIQEPLFSLGIGVEGQQLIAERHTYSSFKHQVRMAYHKLSKQE
jgi:hypothetical protein